MNSRELIQETLTLSEGVPLFDFNVNFTALKKLLVDFNLNLNSQKEEIDELRLLLRGKADKEIVEGNFALLNGALNLTKDSYEALNIKQKESEEGLRPIDSICEKTIHLTKAIDHLLKDTAKNDSGLNALDKKVEERVKQSGKAIGDRLDNMDETMKKNMDLYYKDANSNFVRIEALIKQSQVDNASKLGDALALLDRKVNQDSLKSHLDALDSKIETNLRRMIEADQVKRANQTNDILMKIRDSENTAGDKQVAMMNRLSELIQRIGKSLTIQGFEKEKTKLYEKLAEQKGRIEDLVKKAEDYTDYKRATIIASEKTKQEVMSVQDDINRLKEKAEASTSLGNVSALLEKIDPHKMCELEAAVKLHAQLISRLEKHQLSTVGAPMKQAGGTAPAPKSGMSAEETRKFIKEYIGNMDMENRLKNTEKTINEFSKRVDCIADLEKKLYSFTKEFDFGSLTRQLNKKCNNEETRKDIKITNGRIDQLHDFLKLIRKDMDQFSAYIRKNQFRNPQPSDNALLTGKKLYPLNCLSCYSGSRPTRNGRTLRSPAIDNSLEIHELNNTLGEDDLARRSSLNMRKR